MLDLKLIRAEAARVESWRMKDLRPAAAHLVELCELVEHLYVECQIKVEQERALIVAWLRKRGVLSDGGRGAYATNPYVLDVADAIERGEYLPPRTDPDQPSEG